MDTITEPNLLQVLEEGLIILIILVTLVIAINILQGLANHQVVLAVLVKEDVAAIESGLSEVVNQLLLLE